MQMAAQEMKAQEALGLVKGWFNNKMTVVIFRIQYAHLWARKTGAVDVREQLIFLNDIQHHYSRQGNGQRAYQNSTRWLKAFFRVYPKHITAERSEKAWQMIQSVYEGFGMKFPINGSGARKEK